jgi:hypothetical protein
MTIRSVRHAERVLTGLDPAPTTGHAATAAERAAILHDVLSLARDDRSEVRRRPAHRRRLVLVGAALAVIAGASTAAVDLIPQRTPPVYAATPALLHYEMPAHAPAAADLLRAIAATAEASPTRGSGDYEYIHVRYWTLSDPKWADRDRWSVQPGEVQWWRRIADGSGLTIHRESGTSQDVTEQTSGPGELNGYPGCVVAADPVPPGQPITSCPTDRLADRETMLRLLTFNQGHGLAIDQTGRLSPLSIAASVARYRVLPSAVRAQLWRVLADLPGIAYTGRVTDRAGRTGEAFSMDFDAGFGRARDTLIVDPATGELLDYERILLALTEPEYLAEAGVPDIAPLRIRTPATIDYWVILTAERRPTSQ